jgi:hypothetical protein
MYYLVVEDFQFFPEGFCGCSYCARNVYPCLNLRASPAVVEDMS